MSVFMSIIASLAYNLLVIVKPLPKFESSHPFIDISVSYLSLSLLSLAHPCLLVNDSVRTLQSCCKFITAHPASSIRSSSLLPTTPMVKLVVIMELPACPSIPLLLMPAILFVHFNFNS